MTTRADATAGRPGRIRRVLRRALAADVSALEARLAGMEDERVRLRAELTGVRTGLEDLARRHAESAEAVVAWIRGAEAHLAGLQAEWERARGLQESHTAQQTRVIARTSLIESRTQDLERAITEIAETVGRSGLAKQQT
jgi:chromosome segregation ATPase